MLLRRSRADSDQGAQWKSLRRKTNRYFVNSFFFITLSAWPLSFFLQSRLWDKVAALPQEPVAGRSHFMGRMRATVSLSNVMEKVPQVCVFFSPLLVKG